MVHAAGNRKRSQIDSFCLSSSLPFRHSLLGDLHKRVRGEGGFDRFGKRHIGFGWLA